MSQKLANLPQLYSLSDYDKAAEELVKRYSSHSDVIAIYQFGNVTVPGISDLDFLVVAKDRLSIPFGKGCFMQSFNEDLRYLYNNTPPFLMTEDIYKSFWKIFPVTNLKLLYGNKRDVVKENFDNTVVYQTLSLIDICIYFYPMIFMEQLYSTTMDVRRSLLILNSLRFPLAIMSSLTQKKIQTWEEFMESIERLRLEWFQNDNKRFTELRGLLEKACIISVELIQSLAMYIQNTLWLVSTHDKDIAGRFFHYIFLSHFNLEKIYKIELEYYQKNGRWHSLQPAVFLLPLIKYSECKGIVSCHLRNNLIKGRIEFDWLKENILEIMENRIKLINQHAFFFFKNKIEIPMVHNYFLHDPSVKKTRLKDTFLYFLNKYGIR